MRRLLWIGDAACDSGFAKCTHNTVEGFRDSWDIHVLGLNYRGDPHDYPYKIYPAYLPNGDLFGTTRVDIDRPALELLSRVRPDCVVIQNDPWNIPAYVARFDKLKDRPFLVGAIAVDGKNCRGRDLNGLDHVVFWTHFAEEAARAGGYTGTSSVVPLGVDLNMFTPGDRAEARRALGLPEEILDGFYFLNVNRNQPRKRLDLTVEAFAEFYHEYAAHDAYLYLHVCPTGDAGYDLDQLTAYYDLRGHVVLAEPGVWFGASERELVMTYRAADVLVSTSQGEGWGLTAMEAIACGKPAILPDHSAFGDWAKGGAKLIECTSTAVTPNRTNVIGAVPDRRKLVEAMAFFYRNPAVCEMYSSMGLELVHQPKYRWENIASAFASEVNRVYEDHVARRARNEGQAQESGAGPSQGD